jgi:hypothetical protein
MAGKALELKVARFHNISLYFLLIIPKDLLQ